MTMRVVRAVEHELWSLNESGDLVHNKPETLYNLRFMSPFHKDEFVKAIIEHSTAASSVGAKAGVWRASCRMHCHVANACVA